MIRLRDPRRHLEAVEFATLERVDWFNHDQLPESNGHVPPAELEVALYAQTEESVSWPDSDETASGKTGTVRVEEGITPLPTSQYDATPSTTNVEEVALSRQHSARYWRCRHPAWLQLITAPQYPAVLPVSDTVTALRSSISQTLVGSVTAVVQPSVSAFRRFVQPRGPLVVASLLGPVTASLYALYRLISTRVPPICLTVTTLIQTIFDPVGAVAGIRLLSVNRLQRQDAGYGGQRNRFQNQTLIHLTPPLIQNKFSYQSFLAHRAAETRHVEFL